MWWTLFNRRNHARRPARSRLSLESLERRDTPSGGGHHTFAQHSVHHAPHVGKVAHVAQELAAGDRQRGYPLPPQIGPKLTGQIGVTARPVAVVGTGHGGRH